ncbi:NAD(P)H-quinone dehydrogenase [Angustibacter sp. McL0619]|uniref:NAD(P)H-quinone dehydrogenase n=1 Tax=Angustibacter sp. McL0619 TaxID=3415676 RepID=UPI003CEA09BD
MDDVSSEVVGRAAQRVVIVGGGPGGYESALVAAHLGAEVTVVDRDGVGGAAVLTDCVPSKTLISTADFMSRFFAAAGLGVKLAESPEPGEVARADMPTLNKRIKALAEAQSADIAARLERDGVTVVRGTGRLDGPERVVVEGVDGSASTLNADVVLVSTGARPRELASAAPDGERILTWQQVYDVPELPEHVVVVGSGVTGAEFAHAYLALGCDVTLVSSRDRVLPGEDPDAALVIEDVFRRRGMNVLGRSRAESVVRDGEGVLVTLTDGRTVSASHCVMAVGSVPNTEDVGLDSAGVDLTSSGHIRVDAVSRTTARGVYAAGDCTGVLPLASVAAMQGRTAISHALGDAVAPLNLRAVAANIFTDPEIATVGWSAPALDEAGIGYEAIMLPLATNPRAKMQNVRDGFVKLFSRSGSGVVLGGVVVAPWASELIFPVALAVQTKLTVDQVAASFTVYPSMSGSIAEAARQLHARPS